VITHLRAIEMKMQQRRPATARPLAQLAVRHHDLFNWLRDAIKLIAQPQGAPHAIRSKRDRECPAIKSRRQRIRRLRSIDDDHRNAGLIQRQRQRLPYQAAAAQNYVSVEAVSVAHGQRYRCAKVSVDAASARKQKAGRRFFERWRRTAQRLAALSLPEAQ